MYGARMPPTMNGGGMETKVLFNLCI